MTVAGRGNVTPATLVAPVEPIQLAAPARRFASRGGDKLDGALDRFRLEVSGKLALDAGASTGGFTDCLLRRGVGHVVALDVGYGQLAWELRQDPRVTVKERTNVRDLDPWSLPYRPDLVTADLSFISLRLALPALVRCSSDDADLVLLVKPQFEAGREDVSRRGVVSDPGVWERVLVSVARQCVERGLDVEAFAPSPILGPAGNAEFFLLASRRPSTDRSSPRVGSAVIGEDVEDAARRAASEALEIASRHG